tara:strand:- start:499 stop:750 length:252 start_codon:yes stop_codon:yes gene_type:complete
MENKNKHLIIFPIKKNLLYYSMNKAYKKALKVIDSCKNSAHIHAAFNYIWNFERLFSNNKTCAELTKRLRNKCTNKRKTVGNI